MQTIKAALVQLAWTGSRDSMVRQYHALIPQAVQAGASLVCLPEFSLIPYFPGTREQSGFDWAEALPGGYSEQFFAETARRYHITLIGSLYEKAEDGQTYDTATVHGPDGRLIGITRKVHIPSGEGYHETDFFGGADSYPVHHIGALNVAAPTCYDQWFPELARIYALSGAHFIYYPTAIGAEPNDLDMDTQTAWQTVMRGHAIANGVFVGAANRVGEENGVRFYGSSFICAPSGKILAQAGRETTEVITATLDAEALRHWRSHFPLLHQRKPATYGRLSEGYTGDDPPDWLEVR